MIELHYNQKMDRIELRNAKRGASLDPEDAAKIQRLLGVRWSTGGPRWVWVPATRWHANQITTLFPNYTAKSDQCARHISDLLVELATFHNALNRGQHRHHAQSCAKQRLFTHQAQALAAIEAIGFRALIGDEMGLGKTKVAIVASKMVHANLLVICPATIKDKWKADLAVEGIEQSHIVQPKKLRELQQATRSAQAIICNYEIVSRPEILAELQGLAAVNCMVVLDESHYVKTNTAKRTIAVRSLSSKWILLLTGTPIRSLNIDLYSQIEMIRPDFFRSMWEFKDRFLVENDAHVGKGRKAIRVAVANKNEKELNGITSTLMIRRLKRDVLNLPPVLEEVIEFDLELESAASYRLMAERWRYHFSLDQAPTFDRVAQTAMEQALRLEQICSGYLQPVQRTPLEGDTPFGARADVREGFFAKPAKLAAAIEMIEDLLKQERRVIIYSKFNKPLDELEYSLNGTCPVWVLTGDTPVNQRSLIIEAFNTGNPGVLLCQVRIAEGWDAQACQDIIFLSRDWSPAVNQQAIARCHRIGQAGTVNVYYLVAKNTIEQRIFKRIEAKGLGAALTLGDLQDSIE
jgi:SNF2 family DNA or RNA helicase